MRDLKGLCYKVAQTTAVLAAPSAPSTLAWCRALAGGQLVTCIQKTNLALKILKIWAEGMACDVMKSAATAQER